MSWIPFPDNKYAWDNFPVKQTNATRPPTASASRSDPAGGFLSMATGFPAPDSGRHSR